MKRQDEIEINQFQLGILLDKGQKNFYDTIISANVFCSHCRSIAEKGVLVEEIYLTHFNDILVKGSCKVCNGSVARIIEFGKDETFFKKADELRKSMKKRV